MKPFIHTLLRAAAIALAVAILSAAVVRAQVTTGGRIQIDSLDRLDVKAAEMVNVSLDEHLLQIVPQAFDKNDPDEMKAKEIIAGLKGVYVKVFEFDVEGAYDRQSDVEPIRQQLKAPGWSRIVEVRSRREGKEIEVYLLNNGSRVDGLTVLAFEPKQLVVVNIVGTIDLEKLRQLEGQFGVPALEIEKDTKPQKK
ncbi:MAG TPA: DUF4252 domain-containing protein [Pyrinomonadaceae bacterium]|jgi:hypothetical protein|nr:DUF4252 domain-containing protein [Pyrinomonadaceae bacterium]